MSTIVADVIEILTSGLTAMAEGIGTGLSTLAQNVFLVGTTSEAGAFTATGLSTFGYVVCIFGGISLAVGLSTFVVKWVSSLGARN